ncbi:hypothetical protein AciM339_0607 [Aciduliprofundum sp. MAR08-339]|uniref:hypothetical protein n=1 Tax=Aciduliprofundum sp. (strain MAR08-339) TaxID=673860 RepID=UPI0002A4BD42|nr:hypothetical protein AciM339_0607 [Aciduliprofundum sp. MAR08-339]
MNVLSYFLLETSVGNIMWHILLGFLAGIIILPKRRGKIYGALILSIIMEAITDGAHLVNKDITHNMIFFLQIPLALILFEYIFDAKGRHMPLFLTILGINLTHFFSDAVLEGDSLAIFYPLTPQWYTFRTTVYGINATLLSAIALFAIFGLLYYISRKYYSTSSSCSSPQRKEIRRYNFPSFITTVASFMRAL